ncbi:MAG: hypothetical protein PHF79_02995 [Candidatus Pacebacteria bacterium]|nr:hypothetical protein [Candidatus Paceibacterota bacterium]
MQIISWLRFLFKGFWSFLVDTIFPIDGHAASQTERIEDFLKIPVERLLELAGREHKNTPLASVLVGQSKLAAYALLQYQHPLISPVLRELKKRRNEAVAAKFGLILAEFFLKNIVEREHQIIVIPIPLSKRRLHERGFNQNEELARAFVEHMNETTEAISLATNLLIKTTDTLPQASLSQKKRLSNLRDCFVIPKSKNLSESFFNSPHAIFVIIDDITTTGSTFQEACRPLIALGGPNIICLAVAH